MAILFPILFKNDEETLGEIPAYKSLLKQANVSSSVEMRQSLPFSYGLSLYLCWASMVLCGVATAIYAFSTCLLCAEFKLARRKNLISERARLFNFKQSGQNSSQQQQTMINQNSSNGSESHFSQSHHSQKANLQNIALNNRSNHAVTSSQLNSSMNTNNNNNNSTTHSNSIGFNHNFSQRSTVPYKYRLGMSQHQNGGNNGQLNTSTVIVANPQNFPPILGTSSSTLPNTRTEFGGFGALVSYSNSKQYEAIFGGWCRNHQKNTFMTENAISLKFSTPNPSPIRNEVASERIQGSYKQIEPQVFSDEPDRPICETPTKGSKKQSVV